MNRKLIEASVEFLSRNTSSKGLFTEAQVSDYVKNASDILKKSHKGKDSNFHKHTRDGKITVDYSTDKNKAISYAQSHVETLKKHGIDSEARVTRSERQGIPFWYHGVKLKSTNKSLREDVHVLDNEGETHVKVTGAKSVRELDKGIEHHLKTHHGFSHEDVENYYDEAYHDNTPFHHHKPDKGSTPHETRTKEEHIKDIAGRVAQLKKDDEE